MGDAMTSVLVTTSALQSGVSPPPSKCFAAAALSTNSWLIPAPATSRMSSTATMSWTRAIRSPPRWTYIAESQRSAAGSLWRFLQMISLRIARRAASRNSGSAVSAPAISGHISAISASCAARSTPSAVAAERRIALSEVSAPRLNGPSGHMKHRGLGRERCQRGERRDRDQHLRPARKCNQLSLPALVEGHHHVVEEQHRVFPGLLPQQLPLRQPQRQRCRHLLPPRPV